MYMLIRNGRFATDGWRTLALAEDDDPHGVKLPVGPVLVPLPVWRARRTELIYREYEHGWPIGVWLAAGESVASIEQDIHDFAVIAVQAEKSSGGKGFSAVHLLLDRYGYEGELRAIVDLPRQRLAFQKQVSPDAFARNSLRNNSRIERPVLSDRYDFNRPKRFATAG